MCGAVLRSRVKWAAGDKGSAVTAIQVCGCACVYVRACVHVCVRACVRVCDGVCLGAGSDSTGRRRRALPQIRIGRGALRWLSRGLRTMRVR